MRYGLGAQDEVPDADIVVPPANGGEASWASSGMAEGRRGPPLPGVRPSPGPLRPLLSGHEVWRTLCGAKVRRSAGGCDSGGGDRIALRLPMGFR